MRYYIIFVAVLLFSTAITRAQDLLPIVKDNRVGYINSNGETVIQPKFETKVEWTKEVFHGETYRFPKFPQNAYFSDSMAVAQIKKRFWGYPYKSHYALINTKAQIIRY